MYVLYESKIGLTQECTLCKQQSLYFHHYLSLLTECYLILHITNTTEYNIYKSVRAKQIFKFKTKAPPSKLVRTKDHLNQYLKHDRGVTNLSKTVMRFLGGSSVWQSGAGFIAGFTKRLKQVMYNPALILYQAGIKTGL